MAGRENKMVRFTERGADGRGNKKRPGNGNVFLDAYNVERGADVKIRTTENNCCNDIKVLGEACRKSC